MMSNRVYNVGYRKTVLFFLYITPWIDVINSCVHFGGSMGQILRGLMVALNLLLIINVAGKSKTGLTILGIAFYGFLQTLFCMILTTGESLGINIAYFLKIMLFTTEASVLTIGQRKNLIKKKDLLNFWSYSLVVVPILLILSNIFHFGTGGRSGFYISANAMSAVLTIQVLIGTYFSRYNKVYGAAVLLNLSALILLGTKSPLLILLLSNVIIIAFYSKHRVKMITLILVCGVMLYYIATHFFSSQIDAILSYQLYHFNNSLLSNNVVTYLFSGRNNLLSDTLEELNKSSLGFLAFIFGASPYGLGKITAAAYGINTVRGIELDFIEIVLSYGIIITIVVYKFFVKALIAKGCDKNENLFFNVAILACLISGILGGHGITEGISATYCGILVATKISALSTETQMDFNKKGK